jgi:hypothetical protein
MSEQEQFERFQRDVAGHTVTVLRDDGLYRHLRCANGGSYCMSFDVVTWPGYLCYAGDMGCYVFTRIRDMFEFFRGRHTAMVDRGYLAEKCVAGDKPDGVREYGEALFEAAVRSDFETFTEEGWTAEGKEALWENIKDEVLIFAGDGLQRAVQAAQDFEFYDADSGKMRTVFHDFWEHRLEDYTARFWWCCYAIPWAIARYDTIEKSQEVAASTAGDVQEASGA